MYKNIAEKLASYIIHNFDINEDICEYCIYNNYDKSHRWSLCTYDCVDCLIDKFSEKCYWEQDKVCVNDQSQHCADFVDNVKCGGCKYYSKEG